MRRGCELVAVACIGACWGGGKAAIDLTGSYHVSSHVASACVDDVPVAGIEYFKLYSDAGGYAMDVCNPDGTGCFRATTFTDPLEDDGWGRTNAFVDINTSLSSCKLTYSEQSVLLVDTTLTYEVTTYADEIDSGSPACTAAEAGRRGTTMQCARHELLVATQLVLPL